MLLMLVLLEMLMKLVLLMNVLVQTMTTVFQLLRLAAHSYHRRLIPRNVLVGVIHESVPSDTNVHKHRDA